MVIIELTKSDTFKQSLMDNKHLSTSIITAPSLESVPNQMNTKWTFRLVVFKKMNFSMVIDHGIKANASITYNFSSDFNY